ncbi:MAG: hypothetical protein OJF50_005188 [Nitrospira sp.]|nr:hypothetical protein [Nitrospira sp.]
MLGNASQGIRTAITGIGTSSFLTGTNRSKDFSPLVLHYSNT